MSPASVSMMSNGRRVFLQSLGTLALSTAAAPVYSLPSGRLHLIQSLISGAEPLTWLFTGDSITHGALHTMGWRSYPEHFGERLRWELRRVRDVVINTGVSGDTIQKLLSDLEWRVFRYNPRVISLMIGMNDCVEGRRGRKKFGRNLDRFLDEVQSREAIPLLQTPNAIYSANSETRRDLPAYVQIIREVASQRNVPLVDHYRHWLEEKKGEAAMLYWLSDGSIHPNHFGHVELSKLLFKVLDIYDDRSPTCRLFVP